MTGLSPRAAAVIREFAAALAGARHRAGDPSFDRIEEVSAGLAAASVDDAPGVGVKVVKLPTSTVHDILGGRKRESLTKWRRVVSYLVTLRAIVAEDGLDPDVQLGTIAEWKSHYDRACEQLRAQERDREDFPAPAGGPVGRPRAPEHALPPVVPPATPPPAPPDGPPSPCVDAARVTAVAANAAEFASRALNFIDVVPNYEADSASVAVDPGPDPNTEGDPEDLTLSQRRFRESYGRTGPRLLRRAEDGDPQAQFQLAALLGCDWRVQESVYWLERATRAAYPAPLLYGLTDESSAVPYVERCREAAYRIGLDYEAVDRSLTAVVFFRRAARLGHTDAASRAAKILVDVGALTAIDPLSWPLDP
ncbi:hypothetical protein [Actinomadura atramentaria]|uniref:hypothetical protein n=1 Tax=Actinomadura atramentaria TaxID=1990 RepID=UPI0003A9307B|nr:hypothetical protein [Actinomadura atramentaria]